MAYTSQRLLFVVNVDWFFVSHRLPIALALLSRGYEVHLATTYTCHRMYLQSLGIITHYIPFDRSHFKFSNFASCFKIFYSVKSNIIHLISMQPILIGGTLSVFFRRSAFVFAISGFGHIFNSDNIFSKLRKLLVLSLYYLSLRLPSKKSIIVKIVVMRTLFRLFSTILL